MNTDEAWNLKVSHLSDCSHLQPNLKNQNKAGDQDIATCKDPLLQSGSILMAHLAETDYRVAAKEL